MKIDVNIILDEGAYLPTKAHSLDAGFDLRTPVHTVVSQRSAAEIDTGVHVEIPAGYVGMIKSKSGLNHKHGIVAEGVVDAGFTGSIKVKLYNHSGTPIIFEPGEKITQIVFIPIPEVELHEVKEFGNYERGDNGYGSSGRF